MERCRRTWATRCIRERAAVGDSSRCEVLGNVEDMCDDDGRMGRSEKSKLELLLYTEVKGLKLMSATKSRWPALGTFICLIVAPLFAPLIVVLHPIARFS